MVFGAGLGMTSSVQGPALSISDPVIRQGGYIATERVLVYNEGNAAFSFTLTTGGVSPSASYCYTLFDPTGGSTLSSTCPNMATDPVAVAISPALSPGKGYLLEMAILGQAFGLNTVSRLTVTASTGAQQSVDVEVMTA